MKGIVRGAQSRSFPHRAVEETRFNEESRSTSWRLARPGSLAGERAVYWTLAQSCQGLASFSEVFCTRAQRFEPSEATLLRVATTPRYATRLGCRDAQR